jgi:hypothetical protein
MASKPRSEWSDSYRRRVERAEAAGKSRQVARGHKAREHVDRRQREKSKAETEGVLTSAERAYARRIGREFGPRAGDDPDDAAGMAVAFMRRVGAAHFKLQVRRQREAARRYRATQANRTYVSLGMGLLESWSADDGFPDVRWYFYH